MEAVLAYTGVEQIDVISHSMGVTLSRAAIKGGLQTTEQTPYDLGEPLASSVHTFLGIAGGNYGIQNCIYAPKKMCCNKINGWYPGRNNGEGPSVFLKSLNNDPIKEGTRTYALLTTHDEVMAPGDMAWTRYTSEFPTMDKSFVFTAPDINHEKIRDAAEFQYNLITEE